MLWCTIVDVVGQQIGVLHLGLEGVCAVDVLVEERLGYDARLTGEECLEHLLINIWTGMFLFVELKACSLNLGFCKRDIG